MNDSVHEPSPGKREASGPDVPAGADEDTGSIAATGSGVALGPGGAASSGGATGPGRAARSDGATGPASNGQDSGADASETEAMVAESKDRGSFTRYRVMAFITGGFLLLLCLEMFLKYALQLNGVDANREARPVLGGWIAFVHGWIYVVYLVAVFDLWSRMRWGFGRIIALIAGGVVPVLSFVMERNARVWVDETLAARSEAGTPSAPKVN